MSNPSRWQPYFAITTFKILVMGIAATVFGLGIIYLAGAFPGYWKNHAGGDALLNNFGALLVVSVGLGLAWELIGKRSFAREVLETVHAATDLDQAGIQRIGTRWLQDPDWADLFKNVRELDIFVAYGDTWRNSHLGQLQEVARRANARVHVYLADPNDEPTMRVLAARFNQAPDDLQRRIIRTKDDFEALRVPGGADIQVFYFPGDRLFSFYRFDNEAVMTLYRHAKGRSAMVPTLVCKKGGTFYDFLETELAAIKTESPRA